MTSKKRLLTIKTIYVRCLILYSSLLLTNTADAFSEAILPAIQLVRLLSVQNDINVVSKGRDQLMHFIANNVSKTDNVINWPLSNPNTPKAPDDQVGASVVQIAGSFGQLSLPQTTRTGQSNDQQASENIHNLQFKLDTLKTIMSKRSDWLLVLLWDIDGTVLYEGPSVIELNAKLNDALLALRQNGQLLLIYNTARDYYRFSFRNWSRSYPEPDIIIAGEGSRYFFNRFVKNPLFDNKIPAFIESYSEANFDAHYWNSIRPDGCSTTISVRSLKNKCPFFAVESISSTIEKLKNITKTKPMYQYWYQPSAFSSTILFAYHKLINKGASFSRLMNALSEEFPSFRDKIKVVTSAGDSLPDTAMMHPDMHYPFDESYQATEDTPRLPLNTVFAGAVLSKAGVLQQERFKPLFESIETVNSKIRSLLGIVEGTVTLLLKQMPPYLVTPDL